MADSEDTGVQIHPFYAQSSRQDSRDYDFEESQHLKSDFTSVEELRLFLGFSEPLDFKTLHQPNFSDEVDEQTFADQASTMAKSLGNQYFGHSKHRMVFRRTANKIPQGHPSDTRCRADIVAAFADHFGGDGKKDPPHWPHIRMVGEYVSRDKSRREYKSQAISHLRCLILARPDLHVALGMHVCEHSLILLVGVGGYGVRCWQARWNSEELPSALYYFIHHAYKSDRFRDRTYEPGHPILGDDGVTRPSWKIKFMVPGDDSQDHVVDNFVPLYASNPFGTRTHVFVRKGGVTVGGQTVTVFKDQLCEKGRRFYEHELLERVHKDGTVPGVVEAVYHESRSLPCELDDLNINRFQLRHGLRQFGSPLATIPNMGTMLQVAFDLLEVIRFLRKHRRILHRDISIGNVMCQSFGNNAEDLAQFPDTTKTATDLCFSAFLIADGPEDCRPSPLATNLLLVDFNHGEDLASKTEPRYKRTIRTGTPIYMARAVSQSSPLKLLAHLPRPLPSMPPSPQTYILRHPERVKKFPAQEAEPFAPKLKPTTPTTDWRHDIDHDTESVLWVVYHCILVAKPKGIKPDEKEADKVLGSAWKLLTGSWVERDDLLMGLAVTLDRGTSSHFHPTFEPLIELLVAMAQRLVVVDRHWLDASYAPRNDPEFLTEAFQRLILDFIIKHKDDPFMHQEIDPKPCELEQGSIPSASTASQWVHSQSDRATGKRSASETAESSRPRRRPRFADGIEILRF